MLDIVVRKRTKRANILLVVLVILLLLNLTFIWHNSSKVSDDSNKTSHKIAEEFVKKTVRDYDKLEKSQQQNHIKRANTKIRSFAHFAEFVPLGFLVFLLALSTVYSHRRTRLYIFCFALSVVFCILCALGDEIHQIYVPGRKFEQKDIATDTLGSFIGMIIAFAVSLVFRTKGENI